MTLADTGKHLGRQAARVVIGKNTIRDQKAPDLTPAFSAADCFDSGEPYTSFIHYGATAIASMASMNVPGLFDSSPQGRFNNLAYVCQIFYEQG